MASGQSFQSSRPPRPCLPSPILLKGIQKHYDTAMQLVNEGLSLDENGKSNDAINMYTMAIEEIQKAMEITVDDQQLNAEDRESYRRMMHKLAKTKMQTESRLDMLRLSNSFATSSTQNTDGPPSYEEVMSSSSGEFSSTSNYSNVLNGNRRVSQDATQIFCIDDGVQIFYITPDGHVTAPSYPSALTINHITLSEDSSADTPPAFLQVGEWVYPMLPGMSPVLQSTYGAYIFPDMLAPQEGCAVGLILPETISKDEREFFEDLLASMTHFQRQEGPPEYIEVPKFRVPVPKDEGLGLEEEERTSTKVARGIEKVADFLAWGLGKGAEQGTVLMKKGSEQIISRISPGDRKRIDPTAQKGAEYLRVATHSAVRVSGFALSKLGDATMAVGRMLAPHIKEHGSKLLPKSVKRNPETASNIDAAVEVAASGIKGFGTVYLGLEAAAKHLGRGLTEETVHIVNYKYGSQAAKAAENTLYSVGNVAMTANNVGNFGAKAVAKKAVKETGKALIFQHEQNLTENRRRVTENPNVPSIEKTKSITKPH